MIRNFLIAAFVSFLSFPAFAEFDKIEKSAGEYKALYVGTTSIDGLPVIVALEQAEHEVSTPESNSNEFETMPTIAGAAKKVYRISIIAQQNGALKARFGLMTKVASVDGQYKKVFVSSDSSEFQFVISAEKDGSLHAFYKRQISLEQVNNGELSLQPLMNTL